jgi:hypothetical protein
MRSIRLALGMPNVNNEPFEHAAPVVGWSPLAGLRDHFVAATGAGRPGSPHRAGGAMLDSYRRFAADDLPVSKVRVLVT